MEKRVLCVDDDSACLRVLEEVVKISGYVPVCANNGAEALEAVLAQGGLVLVLADIKMPVMDGIEFATRVRAHNNQIPIVAVTAYAENSMMNSRGGKSVINQCTEAGMNGFLTKPYTIDVLQKMIEEYAAEKLN